jgi:hypothetical protein
MSQNRLNNSVRLLICPRCGANLKKIKTDDIQKHYECTNEDCGRGWCELV